MQRGTEVGRRILAWREAKGMSRRALADAVGVTPAAVYQWEGCGADQTSPSQRNLASAVDALGLTMAEFYGPLPKKRAAA